MRTHFFPLITIRPNPLEKVDTWAQNPVTYTPPRSYALSESGHKLDTSGERCAVPLFGRGVACYARNSAQRAARWGFRMGATYYTLTTLLHHGPFALRTVLRPQLGTQRVPPSWLIVIMIENNHDKGYFFPHYDVSIRTGKSGHMGTKSRNAHTPT